MNNEEIDDVLNRLENGGYVGDVDLAPDIDENRDIPLDEEKEEKSEE